MQTAISNFSVLHIGMPEYNLVNIHTLLTQGFDETELRWFIEHTISFYPIVDDLPQGVSFIEVSQKIIDFAEREKTLEHLLVWAKDYNSEIYETYQPYYIVPPPSSDEATSSATNPMQAHQQMRLKTHLTQSHSAPQTPPEQKTTNCQPQQDALASKADLSRLAFYFILFSLTLIITLIMFMMFMMGIWSIYLQMFS